MDHLLCGAKGSSVSAKESQRSVAVSGHRWCAFAAILEDGSAVAWGNPRSRGDSSAIQDQLRNVQQLQAMLGAFAAILADGSVVTWGSDEYGGDSSEVVSCRMTFKPQRGHSLQ